jgi:pseudouridine-5'-phosphate glycosidase
MNSNLDFTTSDFVFKPEVAFALAKEQPIVALESTVITHGLPRPINLKTALELEEIVRQNGATPATIGILNGVPHIGLTDSQIEFLANSENVYKLSRRDLPVAIACKLNGATTVAATAFFAYQTNIQVFATGGIGGVHRDSNDVSADLPALSRTPITVVCSGAKSILDLPATREWLETFGICVLGFQTNEMPAFYSRSSNLKVDARIETVNQVAEIIRNRDRLKLESAIMLAVPIAAEFEIPVLKIEELLRMALQDAKSAKISGNNLTPFLLGKMADHSGGSTVRANLAILKQNARIAAQTARAFAEL